MITVSNGLHGSRHDIRNQMGGNDPDHADCSDCYIVHDKHKSQASEVVDTTAGSIHPIAKMNYLETSVKAEEDVWMLEA